MTSTYPYCSPPGDGRQGYGHCLSNHDESSKITGYGLQPARPHHSPADAAAPRAGVHRRNSPSSPWEAVKKYHWPLAGSSRSASHGSHGRSKLPAARLRGICTRNQMCSFQGSSKALAVSRRQMNFTIYAAFWRLAVCSQKHAISASSLLAFPTVSRLSHSACQSPSLVQFL